MVSSIDPDQLLSDLAAYLHNRRNAVLDKWRTACEQDPRLAHVVSLSREEFNNMLPALLEILESRLRSHPDVVDPIQLAKAHGLHRWHKGRSLHDLMIELDYLYDILSEELHLFRQINPNADPMALLTAAEQIARLKSETMAGSATEYDVQQQLTAASRSNGLQQALDQLNQLSRNRTDLLRTSSHDLKGTLGVIQGAAFLLNQEGKTDEERGQLVEMVNRNLGSIRTMLAQLTDLARLEAGQEKIDNHPFDAAQLLRELVAAVQPLADEKKLTLQADGPDTLPVTGDAVKVQRIMQNLLLNAIKHTPRGIVSVSWSREGNYRWYVSVQDSGAGLPGGQVAMLARQLEPLPEQSSVFNRDPQQEDIDLPPADPSATSAESVGEGIGLHIVKHLCDLLGANIDVETSPSGTLVRIRLLIEQLVQKPD